MTNAVSPNDPGYLCARRHFLGEPEAALYTQLIHDADRSIVIEGQIGPDAGRQCDVFFRRADIIIEPFTVEQAHLARQGSGAV